MKRRPSACASLVVVLWVGCAVAACAAETSQLGSAGSGGGGGSASSGGTGGVGTASSSSGSTGGAGTGGQGSSSGSTGGAGAGGQGSSSASSSAQSSSSGSANCVAGAPCTVSLESCAENQKAPPWQGQTTLKGTFELVYYTSHKGWACMAPVQGGQQGWPVIPEPGWWCGTVIEACTCSPADGCY